MEDRSGTTVGGFRLLRRVGQGPQSAAYQGENELYSGSFRLIKIIESPLLLPGPTVDKLLRLDHPHLQRFFGLRKDGDCLFLELEWVEGEPLLARHARPEEEVLSLLQQAASGLSALHEAGLVQGELRPANFLRTGEGSLKLRDVGLYPRGTLRTDVAALVGCACAWWTGRPFEHSLPDGLPPSWRNVFQKALDPQGP